MASDSVYGQLINFDVVAINNGELVRVSGTNRCVLAQADAAAHVQGLAGASLSGVVGVFGPLNVASNGFSTRVRLEAGLVPVAGETIYVSATVAGRATNIVPALAVAIGTIEDPTGYALDGRVQAILSIAGASSGGTFAGFGGPPAAVAMTVPAASGVANTALRSDSTRGQFLMADWDLSVTRTFLYDPVNGVDTNPGFSDGAGPYNPALLARKTIAGMLKIFPRHFAGRMFRLFCAAGAYANADLDNLLAGITGYASQSLVRATGTLATAGAVAFTDDAADRVALGATTATGCNAPGYNAIGVPTATVVQLQLAGGGAAGLGAEPASPLMWRVRGASTNAQNANVCRTVIVVAGTDTITLDSALPVVPTVGNGDVYFLEMPSTTFPAIRLSGAAGEQNQTTTGIDLQLAGVRSLGVLQSYGLNVDLAFCGCAGAMTLRFGGRVNVQNTYRAVVNSNTNTTVGGGLRSESTGFMSGETFGGTLSLFVGNTSGLQGSAASTVFGNGSVVNAGLQMGVAVATTVTAVGASSFIAAQNTTRVIGPGTTAGIDINGGQLNLDRVAVTNMGANPAISIRRNGVLVLGSACTGSTGNTDVGLDLSGASAGEAAKGALIILFGLNGASNVPTVTGTVGDIRDAGGNILTWAQVAATGYVDRAGNRFISASATGAGPLAAVYGTGFIDEDVGGLVVSYCAASQLTPLIAAAAVDPLAHRYPTSLRLIRRLRVHTRTASGLDVACAVTVMKNGVATGLTVSIPAATPINTKFSIESPVVFADGDDWDVQMSQTASEIGSLAISWQLEQAM